MKEPALRAEPPGGDGPAPYEPHSLADVKPSPVLESAYADANAQMRDRLWWAGSTVYKHRWFVLWLTALIALASIVLTLRMPNQYRAETRVLLPDGGSAMAGALAGLAPAAAMLLGGSGGGFTRYMAILNSPSTHQEIVERFDLVEVYDVGDDPNPQQAAISELRDRAAFEVSVEFDYLSVSVLDEDPQRSAQLSNYFVELLNRRNVDLTSSSAGANRRFLEQRLETANAELDSAQAEMQALQERSGVVEPTAQAAALFTSLAAAQGQVAEAEAQYQALLTQAGPENSAVQSAAAALQSARSQVARLQSGAEAGMPAMRDLPQVQREYASVMQDVVIQTKIIETIQPLYEQAALEERRDTDAVQVLDVATPPHKKAAPRRSVIVIGATLSAFLLGILFVLVHRWGREHIPSLLSRLRTTA